MLKQVKREVKRARDFLLQPLIRHQEGQAACLQKALMVRYQESLYLDTPLPSFRDVGWSNYSGADEDGILLYIFALIGMEHRRAVDIGCSTVEGSNTGNLILHHGWTALLIDGDQQSVRETQSFYAGHPRTAVFPPAVVHSWITAENINTLLQDNGYVGNIDLLSLDLDGIDYWVWKALDIVRPRVVVAEYQDIIGPERALTVPYDPGFRASQYAENQTTNNYVGASLRALAKLADEKGYRLVGCNQFGWNAFFVLRGLGEDALPEVSVDSCFSHPWNEYGMRERWPAVSHMPWVAV